MLGAEAMSVIAKRDQGFIGFGAAQLITDY